MSHPRIATGVLALALLAGASACSKGKGDNGPSPDTGPGYQSNIPDTFFVSNTVPANESSDVSRTQTVYLQFSALVSPVTVNATNITIQEGSNPILPATVNYVPAWNYASIKAVSTLNPSAVYTVKVSAGVHDALGGSITPLTFSFMTSATSDVTPPTFTGASSAVSVGTPTHPFGVDVGWTQAGETPVEYDVYVSTVSGEFNYIPDLTVTDQASAIVDMGPNTAYFCKVMARDADGNVSSNTFQFPATTEASFQHNVWPLLKASCSSCHSPETSRHYDGTQPPWDQQVWLGGAPGGFPDWRSLHSGYWSVQSMSMATPAQAYLNWVDDGVFDYDYDGTGAAVAYVVQGSSGEPPIPGAMRRIARPAGPVVLADSFVWQRMTTTTWTGAMHLGTPALTSNEQSLFQTWLQQGAKFN